MAARIFPGLSNRSLLLIDLGGAALAVTVLATAAWVAVLKPDTATSRMRTLAERVLQLQADLAELQRGLDEQAGEHRRLTEKAGRVGRLPTQSPIEQDLHTITALAHDHHIRLVEVSPLSTVEYPNVRELRFRVKTTGTYQDHLAFFESFEACTFWADITHLKIEQSVGEMIESDPTRRADLTISFFAAAQ